MQNTLTKSPKETFRTKDKIADIISMLANVDDDTIENQITRMAENKRFSAAVSAYELVESNNLDTTVYCCKTGQPIRQYSDDEITKLIEIHGKERTAYLLQRLNKNHVATHWIYTDADALRSLAEYDPCGYFVYSVSMMLAPFQKCLENKFDNYKTDMEHLKQRRICYRQISERSLQQVIKANEIIRRYLALGQTLKVIKYVAFKNTEITDVAANEENLQQLIDDTSQSITNILQQAAKQGKIKPELSYADVVSLKLAYEGYSNFRDQRKPQNLTPVESILRELEPHMKDIPEHHVYNARLRTKRIKEMEKNKKQPKVVDSNFQIKTNQMSKERKQNAINRLFGKK